MTQTETDPDDMTARLAADIDAWGRGLAGLADHLAALGWRKAAVVAELIRLDVEAMTLDFVRQQRANMAGQRADIADAIRHGLREASCVADAMAMDAIRGPRITKAQETFAEAAKRVADAVWALRMRIEVTR